MEDWRPVVSREVLKNALSHFGNQDWRPTTLRPPIAQVDGSESDVHLGARYAVLAKFRLRTGCAADPDGRSPSQPATCGSAACLAEREHSRSEARQEDPRPQKYVAGDGGSR